MSKAQIKRHPPGTSQGHIDKMKELMDQGMEFGPAHDEAERLGFKAKPNAPFQMMDKRAATAEARKADVAAFAEKYYDTPIENRITMGKFSFGAETIGRENEQVTENEYKNELTVLFKKFHPLAESNFNNERSNEVRRIINQHLADLYDFDKIKIDTNRNLSVIIEAPKSNPHGGKNCGCGQNPCITYGASTNPPKSKTAAKGTKVSIPYTVVQLKETLLSLAGQKPKTS